ncbi:hypothetical protein ABBQ32_007724 [Trebouxia sp. C0010 RCD-2024]
MHRGSDIPRSIRPPNTGSKQQQCGWPHKHLYGKAGYGASGEIEDSRIAVVLATLWKMACKWPIWLQIKMTRATLSGLPKGLSYGCALGTIVGVEAGFSHTVADMTCTQCDLGMVGNVASTVSNVVDMGRPEVAAACCFAAMVGGNMDDVRDITCTMIDQGHFQQAVWSSYETVLLGTRSGQAHLIAQSTVNVGQVGQRYIEMLAEVVAQLVKAGHGRPAAQVCLLVIAQGYLGLAMKISATMMKRGHLKETAKVSRYLVAAGHTDFKQCLAGEGGCKGSGPHPAVCKMARRWTRLLSFAAFAGGVVALHYFPKHRSELSDSISEKGRQKTRQVAHHLGNAKRSFGSRSSPDSDSEREELDRVTSSSSETSAVHQLNSHHEMLHSRNQGELGKEDRHKQVVYSSEEEDDW